MSTKPETIPAELRDLCAYIDARPWENERGNREPGAGDKWAT